MQSTPDCYVLDTFALIAYFRAEPAAPQVVDLLNRARDGRATVVMSLVNWGEVLYAAEREGGSQGVAEVIDLIGGLPMELITVDRRLAQAAASLKARYPMSYADCYAAALGRIRDAAVVTGDPEFHSVENFVAIEWLPQRQARGVSRET